jgi:hypothetical protein
MPLCTTRTIAVCQFWVDSLGTVVPNCQTCDVIGMDNNDVHFLAAFTCTPNLNHAATFYYRIKANAITDATGDLCGCSGDNPPDFDACNPDACTGSTCKSAANDMSCPVYLP